MTKLGKFTFESFAELVRYSTSSSTDLVAIESAGEGGVEGTDRARATQLSSSSCSCTFGMYMQVTRAFLPSSHDLLLSGMAWLILGGGTEAPKPKKHV